MAPGHTKGCCASAISSWSCRVEGQSPVRSALTACALSRRRRLPRLITQHWRLASCRWVPPTDAALMGEAGAALADNSVDLRVCQVG
eukprot:4368730-Amphidinium_carterae.1